MAIKLLSHSATFAGLPRSFVVASLRMTAGFLLLMSPTSVMRASAPGPKHQRKWLYG